MRLIRPLGVFVLLLTLAGSARAQFPTGGSMRPIHFWIGGGVSVPVSDSGDALDTGFHGRGMVTFQPPGLPVALRGDVSFQKFDLKSAELGGGVEGGPTPSTQILSGLGNVTFGLQLGPLRPYVGAGLGAFQVKTDSGVEGEESDSQVKFGINGIVGATLSLSRNVSLFAEGRVENIYTDEGQQVDSANDIQVVPVTFGIVF